jgi:hypothetical protein
MHTQILGMEHESVITLDKQVHVLEFFNGERGSMSVVVSWRRTLFVVVVHLNPSLHVPVFYCRPLTDFADDFDDTVDVK